VIAPELLERRVAGDPDALDRLARDLKRRAVACADVARAADAAEPVSWKGAAAAAYTQAEALVNARLCAAADLVALAAAALSQYAATLRQAQQEARRANDVLDEADRVTAHWQALPLLHRPVADPGDPLRARGWNLLERANADVDQAARGAAVVLLELLPEADPSQRSTGVLSRIGHGAAESSTALWRSAASCGLPGMLTASAGLRCATDDATELATAVRHPLAAGKALLDWDTWARDPARAVGHLLPNALLALATGGAGRLAEAPSALRAAEIPPTLRFGPHRLEDINGAPGGPHFDNCPSCVIAVDQTLAGAPASAIPDRPTMLRELAARYDSMFVMADKEWITQQLMNAPSGARGIVFGMRADNAEGHVFNAVQEHGRVYFIDGQTGEAGVFQDSFVKLFFLRTDGLSVVGAVDRGSR
jgi:uncharacterized protein YukE